jgi:acetyl-CoA C-acetyltransferase
MGSRKFGRSVSIVGAAYTTMGLLNVTPGMEDISERELFGEAAIAAMKNGNIEAKEIDAYYVGTVAPNYYQKACSSGPHYADFAGLHNKPAIFHDEGCATFNVGLEMAVQAVASGRFDCVMAVGVNSGTTQARPGYPPYIREPLDLETIFNACYTATEPAFEKPGVGGLAGIEAAICVYMQKYGYTPQNYEEAMVNYIKVMSQNNLNNPKGGILFKTSIEDEAKENNFDNVYDYLSDDMYDPKLGGLVRVRYTGQQVDGASAVIVCATEDAHKYTKKPIEVAGLGGGTYRDRDYMDVPNPCLENALKAAYDMADITDPVREIDYMGVHDCCGLALLLDCEAAGYFKPGEGMRAMIEGRVAHDADRPVNTSGGRMMLGHPLGGAAGIEIAEAVDQMRGECGVRQISNPPKTSVVTVCGTGYTFSGVVLKANF